MAGDGADPTIQGAINQGASTGDAWAAIPQGLQLGIQLAARKEQVEAQKQQLELQRQQHVMQAADKFADIVTKMANVKNPAVRKGLFETASQIAPILGVQASPNLLTIMSDPEMAARYGQVMMRFRQDPSAVYGNPEAMKALQAATSDPDMAKMIDGLMEAEKLMSSERVAMTRALGDATNKEAIRSLQAQKLAQEQEKLDAQKPLWEANARKANAEADVAPELARAKVSATEGIGEVRKAQAQNYGSLVDYRAAKTDIERKILPSKIALNKARAEYYKENQGLASIKSQDTMIRHVQSKAQQIDKDYFQVDQVVRVVDKLRDMQTAASDILMIKGLNQFFDSPRVTDDEIRLVGERTRSLWSDFKIKFKRAASIEGDTAEEGASRMRILTGLQVDDIRNAVKEMSHVLAAKKAERKSALFLLAEKRGIDTGLVSGNPDEWDMVRAAADKLRGHIKNAPAASAQPKAPAPTAPTAPAAQPPGAAPAAASKGQVPPALLQTFKGIFKGDSAKLKGFLQQKGYTFTDKDLQ